MKEPWCQDSRSWQGWGPSAPARDVCPRQMPRHRDEPLGRHRSCLHCAAVTPSRRLQCHVVRSIVRCTWHRHPSAQGPPACAGSNQCLLAVPRGRPQLLPLVAARSWQPYRTHELWGGGGVAAAPPMSFVVQRRGAQAPGRHLRTCSRITRPQSTDPVLTLRGNLMHARWSRGVFRQSESELQLFPNDGAHVATNRPAHWTPTKLFTRPQFCFGMSCSLHSTVEGDCAVH